MKGCIMKRWDIINSYIAHYGLTSFLEIGHDKGEAFDYINIDKKESVDPNADAKPTYIMTSDDFFEQTNKTYDMIFIDGLHEHSQVYRDIHNALLHLNTHGVIIMHDCHPPSEAHQVHKFHHTGGEWTGDCWKAFIKARAILPYEMYVCDHDWGCGIIDTNIPRTSDISQLPTIMANMTYDMFISHPEWMNYSEHLQIYDKPN